MLSTLLDSSGDSNAQLLREAVDLIRLGLRARATLIAASGAGRLLADGACTAGAFFLAQDLATGLRSRGVPDAVYSPASMMLLGVLVAIAMLRRDRIAGAGALLWLALRLLGVIGAINLTIASATLLPAICFTVMLVRPRQRSSVPISGLYGCGGLVGLVLLAGAFGGLFTILALVAASAFCLLALALVMIDPRPAIAVAFLAANVAAAKAGSGQPALITLAFGTTVPVIIALTIARTHQLAGASE
jgi:hypothetical protein